MGGTKRSEAVRGPGRRQRSRDQRSGAGGVRARLLAAKGADVVALDLCEDIETNSIRWRGPRTLKTIV